VTRFERNVQNRPKALALFEGFAKRVSEITEPQTEEAQITLQQLAGMEQQDAEMEQELAELNCLVNVGSGEIGA